MGLADVVLGVFDVREGHGAVGVVGPGVQDGSVGVPELEAELAVGENSAEEPLGGADLNGSGGFVEDKNVDDGYELVQIGLRSPAAFALRFRHFTL